MGARHCAMKAVFLWCGALLTSLPRAVISVSLCVSGGVQAADEEAPAMNEIPSRPVPLFNRWEEDWSALADERVPRQPFDDLKYLSLSSIDPLVYLSLGANARERFEALNPQAFGTRSSRSDDYLLSRLELHTDLHLGPHVQIFAQLQSDFAPGKDVQTPVDQDRLGMEQAFIAATDTLAGGTLTVRLGRQEIAFDLQRFISVRDGPNVRQSYDAAWVEFARGDWDFVALFSHPVQNRDASLFDDYSGPRLSHGGAKVVWKVSSAASVSATWAHYIRKHANFGAATGEESRDILDTHASGNTEHIDWDVEAMNQSGSFGNQIVRAWGLGSLAGYTIPALPWTPRVGFQLDAASGNKDPNGHTLGTFNPLFPNGGYETLSGLTGYINFVHAKGSVTVQPTNTLKVLIAGATLWRETTADAIYIQPNIPIADTAGRGGRYTGTYGEVRLDWQLTPNTAFALEADHFAIGEAIRQAGGHDTDYLGVEVSLKW